MVFVYSSDKALNDLTGGGYTFDGPWGTAKVDVAKMNAAGWFADEGWRKYGIDLHQAMLNYGRFLDKQNDPVVWADGLIPGNTLDPEKMKAAGWRLGKGGKYYLDWQRDFAEGTGYYIAQVPQGGPRSVIYKSYEELYGKPWDGKTDVGMPSYYVEPLDEDIDKAA